MALVTLLKHSHRVPALLSACLPPQSPSPDLWAWGGVRCPRVRGFCSGEMSGLLGASGFELSWGPAVLGPGVTRRYASFCASVRAGEQCCYCINLTQLTHLRN